MCWREALNSYLIFKDEKFSCSDGVAVNAAFQ